MLPNKTCARCKTLITLDNARFCTTCGYRLTPTSSPNTSPTHLKDRQEKPATYEQQTKEAAGLYNKVAPRVVRKYGPTKNPTKPIVNRSGRISSFNKSNLGEQSVSDEGSHFLMNPSNASFISYRNDSKYGAPTPSSSSSLTSYKENLAQYLEIENAMKVEDAYSKIYQRAESKVVNSRDITNPSISESSMLSENYHPPKHTNPTLANYTATERQEEKARSVTKKQDYLIHVTPVDELYRKRLEDLREAHQLMPVKDGREHAVPDDDRGPTQGNNAWYWGDNEVKETPEEEGKSEYNSRVGTTYSAASRIYTPYSPFKVGEGDDGIPHFPRATPPRSSGTDVDGKPWTASTGEFSDDEELDPTKSYYWGDKFKITETEEGDDFQFGYEGEDEEEIQEIKVNEDFKEGDRTAAYTFESNRTVSDGKQAPVIIMQQYCQVCDIMSNLIKESHYDFRKDPLYTPGIIVFFQSEMRNVRAVLEHCLRVDAACAAEYQQFQAYWSLERANAANVVNELFEKANRVQTYYDEKYQKAADRFHHMQSQSTLQLSTKPATSDKDMDDIESEAARALGNVGAEIQVAQAHEADIIMSFKSAEYTAINTTSQWKNTFAQLFERLRYIYDRYEIIMRETAARRIQRAVWLKIFLWDPRSERPPYPFDPRSNELYVSTIHAPTVYKEKKGDKKSEEKVKYFWEEYKPENAGGE